MIENILISDEIIKVLNYLGHKIGIAIDWSAQNITPQINTLIENFISWKTATSYFGLIIAVIGLFIGIGLCISDLKFDWEGIGIIIGGFIAIISFVFCVSFIYNIIVCYTFPEKIILETIQTILRGGTI